MKLHDEQKDNQAKKLQQLFAEVNNQGNMEETEEPKSKSAPEFVEVDVLQLPPRSEIHQSSKWSIHVNIKSPGIRFSIIVCVLLAILCILYFFIGDNIIIFFT